METPTGTATAAGGVVFVVVVVVAVVDVIVGVGVIAGIGAGLGRQRSGYDATVSTSAAMRPTRCGKSKGCGIELDLNAACEEVSALRRTTSKSGEGDGDRDPFTFFAADSPARGEWLEEGDGEGGEGEEALLLLEWRLSVTAAVDDSQYG